jgi:ABC-type transport system substrate-binding protein
VKRRSSGASNGGTLATQRRPGSPNGLNLVIKVSPDAEANSRARAMQAMMKQAGINLSIQSNEMSTFFADSAVEFFTTSDTVATPIFVIRSAA